MLNKLILTSLLVSILFEAIFFVGLVLIYKANEKKALRILNTFVFEVTPGFKEKNSFLNYFLIFALLVNIFPFIFLLSQSSNSYTIMMSILITLVSFCLGSLAFVSLDKLREHFYLDLGALACLVALFGIEIFYSHFMYKHSGYINNFDLAAMIISIIFTAFMLVPIFNPKLFILKNKQNEDGSYSRKNFIFLAFIEWMMYIIGLLSLVPIFLITMP